VIELRIPGESTPKGTPNWRGRIWAKDEFVDNIFIKNKKKNTLFMTFEELI
jgi:hypothetical protein